MGCSEPRAASCPWEHFDHCRCERCVDGGVATGRLVDPIGEEPDGVGHPPAQVEGESGQEERHGIGRIALNAKEEGRVGTAEPGHVGVDAPRREERRRVDEERRRIVERVEYERIASCRYSGTERANRHHVEEIPARAHCRIRCEVDRGHEERCEQVERGGKYSVVGNPAELNHPEALVLTEGGYGPNREHRGGLDRVQQPVVLWITAD